MAVPSALLAVFPKSAPVIRLAMETAWPYVVDLMRNGPVAESIQFKLQRFGDLIVWQGDQGRHVIAAIEQIGESQERIDAAIHGIETTQHAMSGTLGILQSVSLATFGVTSLTAGVMLLRTQALNRRLSQIAEAVADVKAHLEAENERHLDQSLTKLTAYEAKHEAGDLAQATDFALNSAAIYSSLTGKECLGKKRLPVLNAWGRRYILSLMTEIQCYLHQEKPEHAEIRVQSERPRMYEMVDVIFRQTLAKNPEKYFHPGLREMGVTLETMTDLYQQLRHVGVLKDVEIRDAADLFEHLRSGIYSGPATWSIKGWLSDWRVEAMQQLRYLVAAVDDVNRVESLRLLIHDARCNKVPFQEVREIARQCIEEARHNATDANKDGFVVYRPFSKSQERGNEPGVATPSA